RHRECPRERPIKRRLLRTCRHLWSAIGVLPAGQLLEICDISEASAGDFAVAIPSPRHDLAPDSDADLRWRVSSSRLSRTPRPPRLMLASAHVRSRGRVSPTSMFRWRVVYVPWIARAETKRRIASAVPGG